MQELLMDIINDTLPMLPFLFITYLLLEYLHLHKSLEQHEKLLTLKRYAPFFGALLGIVPQCGFSIIASGLFVNGSISLGTLIAVFISTSDEAIPVLIAHPEQIGVLFKVILIKLILAILIGYVIDFFYHPKAKEVQEIPENTCSCHEEHDSIWKQASVRTLKIFAFVFIINFILSFAIMKLGEEQLSIIVMEKSFFQPIFATLFGFLPNCAASVMLAQLYLAEVLSFGSLVAGLMSSVGLGLVVLWRIDPDRKEVMKILFILFLSAGISGSILQFFSVF